MHVFDSATSILVRELLLVHTMFHIHVGSSCIDHRRPYTFAGGVSDVAAPRIAPQRDQAHREGCAARALDASVPRR